MHLLLLNQNFNFNPKIKTTIPLQVYTKNLIILKSWDILNQGNKKKNVKSLLQFNNNTPMNPIEHFVKFIEHQPVKIPKIPIFFSIKHILTLQDKNTITYSYKWYQVSFPYLDNSCSLGRIRTSLVPPLVQPWTSPNALDALLNSPQNHLQTPSLSAKFVCPFCSLTFPLFLLQK